MSSATGGFDGLAGAGRTVHGRPAGRSRPGSAPWGDRRPAPPGWSGPPRRGGVQRAGVCGGPAGVHGPDRPGVAQVDGAAGPAGPRPASWPGPTPSTPASLPRAIETAELLAPALAAADTEGQAKPAEPSHECGLCELHPGEADGLTWGEFTERFGDPDWDADPDRPIAPGGESWSGFVQRVDATPWTTWPPPTRASWWWWPATPGSSRPPCWPSCRWSVASTVPASSCAPQHASLTTWEVEDGRWRLLGYNDAVASGRRGVAG